MKRILLISAALLVCAAVFFQIRQPRYAAAPASPAAVASLGTAQDLAKALLQSAVVVPDAPERTARPARTDFHPSGAVRFLGIEPGWRLPIIPKADETPQEIAVRYLSENRTAFGVQNPRVSFAAFNQLTARNRTSIRVRQSYGGLEILAAQAVVQLRRESSDLLCVATDFAREFLLLDTLPLPLTPAVSEEAATLNAKRAARTEWKLGPVSAEKPRLVIYSPEVVGLPGVTSLAWEVRVASPGEPRQAAGRMILNATDGSVLNYFNDIHTALDRRIYNDANNAATDTTTVVRTEGGAATGDAQVDNLYDFIQHTHLFYFLSHLRDGYDGVGGTIRAFARFSPNQTPAPNPPTVLWANASGGGNTMNFGDGWVIDDVVAHEFTHCVTEATSQLLYQNASGAINESLSDIWGEFVDLFNTNLTPATPDTAAQRWLVGEDLAGGAIRSMKTPDGVHPGTNPERTFFDPDRLSSARYTAPVVTPQEGNDNGGVHNNSGVGNKLAYLLTDGDSFNGQTVTGEGVANVADLFYDVQVALLTPGSDWRDLNNALMQSAVNLGWGLSRRVNLLNACTAVEIATAHHDYFVDRSAPAQVNGVPVRQIGVASTVGIYGPFRSIQTAVDAVDSGGTLRIRGDVGDYNVGTTIFTKPMTFLPSEGAVPIRP